MGGAGGEANQVEGTTSHGSCDGAAFALSNQTYEDVGAVAVHGARERLEDAALAPLAHELAEGLVDVLVADCGVARGRLGREPAACTQQQKATRNGGAACGVRAFF